MESVARGREGSDLLYLLDCLLRTSQPGIIVCSL